MLFIILLYGYFVESIIGDVNNDYIKENKYKSNYDKILIWIFSLTSISVYFN
jgi:hypothetical protein